MDLEPDLAAFGEGLAGMDENDAVAEGLGEDFDELASEGDFGDEEDGGFLLFEGLCGQCEVDISFTATGNASEERGGSWGLLEALEGGFLGVIEGDER